MIEHVKGRVHFLYCRDGNLWYKCASGLTFPVPFEDIGGATFLAEDKGIFFMRWIRKYLESIAE